VKKKGQVKKKGEEKGTSLIGAGPGPAMYVVRRLGLRMDGPGLWPEKQAKQAASTGIRGAGQLN
jgi:hypothetical protein